MQKHDITLLDRTYQVSCTPGEEDRLAVLAKLVDSKLRHVTSGGLPATESRLFMLGCLLLADELFDLKEENAKLRQQAEIRLEAPPPAPAPEQDEELFVAAVNLLTQRVDELAGRIVNA